MYYRLFCENVRKKDISRIGKQIWLCPTMFPLLTKMAMFDYAVCVCMGVFNKYGKAASLVFLKHYKEREI